MAVVVCTDPGSPPNSIKVGDSLVYNAKVVYSCEVGYVMVGSAIRVCQANGQWTPGVPTCQGAKLESELYAKEQFHAIAFAFIVIFVLSNSC